MERSPLIAIVDDDPSALQALTGLVRSFGFDALGFAGAEALLCSESIATVDCLITDFRMPEIDGLELHRRLHARPMAMPTILISAHLDAELERRALRVGIVACLAKPPDPDLLLRRLRDALDIQSKSFSQE